MSTAVQTRETGSIRSGPISRYHTVSLPSSLPAAGSSCSNPYNHNKKARVKRTSLWRWQKRYDGTVESLYERSHRPYRHPSQHTPEELKLIKRVWSHNKGLGLGVLAYGLGRQTCVSSKRLFAEQSDEEVGDLAEEAAKEKVCAQTV